VPPARTNRNGGRTRRMNMRRASIAVVALTCICTVAAAVAYAGGDKCTASKGQATMAKAEGCSMSCGSHEFPTMKMMVGDKCVACPMEAEKLAKESNAKVIYAVAGEKFECKDKAMTALAVASEDFVSKYTRIACVVEGKDGTRKIVYCDEEGACSQNAKAVKTGVTGEKSSCCQSGAKTVAAKGDGCCKSGEKASMAKAEGCTKGGEKASLVKAEGSTCHGEKGEKGTMAKAEGCTKGGEKATLAKAEGSTCHGDKGEKTSMVKAEGSCHGEKGEKTTLASAKGDGCCKSGEKGEKASLASAKGEGCCKSGAKATLAKGEDDACCKTSKNTKFLVVGRMFDKYDDAVKARDAAVAAVKTVSVKYVVEGKEVDCASHVCPMAKAAGKVEYVINKDKTKCETQARYLSAKARYEAASHAADAKKMAKI